MHPRRHKMVRIIHCHRPIRKCSYVPHCRMYLYLGMVASCGEALPTEVAPHSIELVQVCNLPLVVHFAPHCLWVGLRGIVLTALHVPRSLIYDKGQRLQDTIRPLQKCHQHCVHGTQDPEIVRRVVVE